MSQHKMQNVTHIDGYSLEDITIKHAPTRDAECNTHRDGYSLEDITIKHEPTQDAECNTHRAGHHRGYHHQTCANTRCRM